MCLVYMIVALDVEPLTIARYLTHIYFGSPENRTRDVPL